MPAAKGKRQERTGSLMYRVTEAVKRRGTATIDDLTPEFPGVPRKSIHDALANARDARLLRVRVIGRRHQAPSVWEPGAHIPSPLPAPKPLRPVPSVFSLGAPLVCHEGEWPPLPAGRVIEKLGAWDSPELNQERALVTLAESSHA